MFQISASGVMDKMNEMTDRANQNLAIAIKQEFSENKNISIRVLAHDSLSEEQKKNWRETDALFVMVNNSIIFHTYPYRGQTHPYLSVEKLYNFDYSLGKEVQTLDPGAHAYLLIRGQQRYSSGGRQALMLGGFVVGALLGVVPSSQGSREEASVALIDGKTGSVLWFYPMQGEYNLQNPVGAKNFVQEFLQHFPIR